VGGREMVGAWLCFERLFYIQQIGVGSKNENYM
jgi:hypothetical protein